MVLFVPACVWGLVAAPETEVTDSRPTASPTAASDATRRRVMESPPQGVDAWASVGTRPTPGRLSAAAPRESSSARTDPPPRSYIAREVPITTDHSVTPLRGSSATREEAGPARGAGPRPPAPRPAAAA